MKMIKIKSFPLLVAIFFILLFTNFTGKITREANSDNMSLIILNYPAGAEIHSPIYIDGNSALVTFIESEELSGDGTYISPFIIENFTIDASTAHGIKIRNTDAYLIIRDCMIEGGNLSYDGIILNDTLNVNISNNELKNNRNGIILASSSNNTISGNTANNNTSFGIGLISSNNNTLSGNTANNNEGGIILWSSSNNTLSGNIVRYSIISGIYLWKSCNNTLFKNNANCNGNGFFLHYSSINNFIYFNDIYENSFTQAYETDDSIDNQWDNDTTGNYWGDDYIIKYPEATNNGTVWDTPYEINGSGDGMDNFPLVNPIFPDLEFPIFTDIPQDFSANKGYSGLNISWIATDLNPGTYTIELDGIELVSATVWTNGTAILYDIPNGLLKGDYNITIIVSDNYGNIAQDTVIFVVNNSKISGFPILNTVVLISICTYILIRKLNNRRNG